MYMSQKMEEWATMGKFHGRTDGYVCLVMKGRIYQCLIALTPPTL